MKEIFLQNRGIGAGHPPFIVAEMSGNHNRSLDRAMEIVEEAAKAGAHALKLQTYTADTMTLDLDKGEFFISDESSLWKGTSLYTLYQEAHTRGSGTGRSSTGPRNWGLFASVHPLTNPLWISSNR
jgi:N-acetylneuraminate synthase